MNLAILLTLASLLAAISAESNWLAGLLTLASIFSVVRQKPINAWPLIGVLALWAAFWLAKPIAKAPTDLNLERSLAEARGAVDDRDWYPIHQLNQFTDWMEDQEPDSMTRLENDFLKLDHPQYLSFSLMSLSFEPIVWSGRPYRIQPGDLREEGWIANNGSAYYRRVVPIPNRDSARAYLVTELNFISEHNLRLRDSWIAAHDPQVNSGQVVLGPALPGSDLPFTVKLLALPQSHWYRETASVVFLLIFVGLALQLDSRLSLDQKLWVYPALGLVLSLSPGYSMSGLSGFSASIAGNSALAALLISPIHLSLTVWLGFLWLRGWSEFADRNRWPSMPMAMLVALLVIFGGARLVQFMSPSPVHPMEALDSAGSALALFACYSFYGLYIWILRVMARNWTFSMRLMGGLGLIAGVFILDSSRWQESTVCALVWLVAGLQRWRPIRHLALAALACSAFYSRVYVDEQHSELTTMGTEIVDDITLLEERNHARIARFRRSLKKIQADFPDFLDSADWLASESGFKVSNVAYGVRVLGPDGRIVSESQRGLDMDLIPAILGPKDRIDSYQSQPGSPIWMFYRTEIMIEGQAHSAMAVLGNDFNALTWRGSPNSPTGHRYFAFGLEAYDHSGSPISRRNALPVAADELEELAHTPFVWRQDGRRTMLLFQDEHYVYRLTHTKTPTKMAVARWLIVTLFIWTILQLSNLASKGRLSLNQIWRRSFAVKFALMVFLGSILPTAALGGLLFGSITRNQAREERDAIQSKMDEFLSFLEILVMTDADRARQDQRAPRSMIDLARQLQDEQVSFYDHGALIRTNRPELFSGSGFDVQLPYSLSRDLTQRKVALATRTLESRSGRYIEALALLPFHAKETLVVGLTNDLSKSRQGLRWQEQAEFTIAVISALLYLMAHLAFVAARRSLRPVKAITRAATRLSRGLSQQALVIDREDELSRMVDAFNTMQRKIQSSQQELTRQLGLFDVTVQTMNSGLLGCDDQAVIVLTNQRCREILSLSDPLPNNLDGLATLSPATEILSELAFASEDREVQIKLGERDIMVASRQRKAGFPGDVSTIFVLEDITHVLAANRLTAWSEMARRVAHEIKNPLTPIQLEIDHINHLFKVNHPGFAEELDASTKTIRQQVEHLRQIAMEFGDYARPFVLESEATQLDELVEEVIAPYQRGLADLQIDLALDKDITLELDRRLMRRALHNLIENAIQAMDGRGRLRVALKRSEKGVTLCIQDNGPGIPEKDQAKVFDAYFSTKDGGTGLGLAIAKRTIEEHLGTIQIELAEEQGTKVVIHFPWD